MGPNVKALLIEFLARIAVPPGGGLADGLATLTNPDKMRLQAKQAQAEMEIALAAVKATRDNPFGDDDEAIAGSLLALLEERRAEQGVKRLKQ